MTLLKHPLMRDVAMCVLRKFYKPEEAMYYLNVRWINIVNPANVFDMGVKEHIVMTEAKYKEFKIYA